MEQQSGQRQQGETTGGGETVLKLTRQVSRARSWIADEVVSQARSLESQLTTGLKELKVTGQATTGLLSADGRDLESGGVVGAEVDQAKQKMERMDSALNDVADRMETTVDDLTKGASRLGRNMSVGAQGMLRRVKQAAAAAGAEIGAAHAAQVEAVSRSNGVNGGMMR
jgi:hypothetical protein